jgi:hypothetical protein
VSGWIDNANVCELAKIICEPSHRGGAEHGFCPECYGDAVKLAAAGCIAPDSLTDKQATTYPFDWMYGANVKSEAERAADVRAALHQIAKASP